MMVMAGLLMFIAWWFRTWRGERLRPALILLSTHVPLFPMMAACIGMSAYLDDRLKWPTLLAYATSLAVMFAIGIPWWRWVYPEIERALLRASHRALRSGVVLAIAVIAGGIGAYVYPR